MAGGRRRTAGWGLCALVALAFAAPASAADTLRAGVGRSDITPPTGFPTFGYVRDDAIGRGVNTRLFARAIVIEQGGRKLAIVTTDLGATPGGLFDEVVTRVASLGFTEQNVIISASHTHSGPDGFSTFQGDNFVAPTSGDPTHFKTTGDPRLYGFLIGRVALAIVRADADLGPARIGWGTTSLAGVTDNRSLEAHLADFGFDEPYGSGTVSQDPGGYLDTIDPEVDVLRVDRVAKHGDVPLGAWLDFADHGTVNPYDFGVYNADHQGAASRIFESAVRRQGHVPRSQDVVGAYGNGDAGDMTAALRGRGPAFAEDVGRKEADAMLRAWHEAGRQMSAHPAFDSRWTRSCFCGRTVEGHQVADSPEVGLPFLTGSEENRGPLYDETHDNYEGRRLPADVGPQGRKIQAIGRPVGDFPSAVPLMVVRLGDRVLATIPGEATVETGRRIRAAVKAAMPASAGIEGVALAGYANEYLHYFTTPEEYEMQHYEGGSTLYGEYSSDVIKDDLATLAFDLGNDKAAPGAVPFDARNGWAPDTTPYGRGAATGKITAQPPGVARMQRAQLTWHGGTQGLDMPLDRPFITVQRRGRHGWHRIADDLGLEFVWRVDDSGNYTAQWQVPLAAKLGRYRFVVTANRYRIVTRPFEVRRSRALTLRAVGNRDGKVLMELDYPPLDVHADLTSRPPRARVFTVAPGTRIAAGSVRDRYGNANAGATVAPS